jgi:hypothetical protein
VEKKCERDKRKGGEKERGEGERQRRGKKRVK